MDGGIRNVAIITKTGNNDAEKAAARIVDALSCKHVKVYSILPFETKNSTSMAAEDLRNIDLDIIFAVGGDGTTLRAFRIIPCKTPLLSINVGGHRGVLSETSEDTISEDISLILDRRYFCESRLRIQASIDDNMILPPALNDILITRTNLTRTPFFIIEMMDDEIKQRMDGIVISTPTGSTGHSLSIGGPILHENLSCIIVAPIACVNRMPQIVVPSTQIEIQSTHDTQLILDGQEVFHVSCGQIVKISRCLDDARFVRLRKRGLRQLAKLGF
jgi:NAD+ kinase